MTTTELLEAPTALQEVASYQPPSIEQAESLERSTPQISRGLRLRIDGLLIGVTMIWGGTFLVAQQTIKLISPFQYLGLCFGVAALTLALIFHRRLMRITRAQVYSGTLIGLFLFAGYALQTHGLQYTTTSKAGFLTGLYVPLVPLLSLIFLRQKPTLEAVIGIVLSLVGLTLLSVNNQFTLQFGLGEVLVLGCAFALTMQIVCISTFVKKGDPINLTILQLAVTSLLCFVSIPTFHESLTWPPLLAWLIILFMGIIDLALTFLAMNWAQQYQSPTRATLVYALEPAWAGLFGYLAGQGLSGAAWIGCACIFLGMIVGGLRLRAWVRKHSPRPD
jgi:drug/metabolite transporter (DMT)-like permease